MNKLLLSRRSVLLGAALLPGCSALNSLNQAAQPRDTYDLTPLNLGQTRRGTLSLLVLEPSAPAAIATDRILIRPDALSVAYLPDARWSDDVPLMMQSLLIRSLSSAGRFGFVGAEGSGPVPDLVLLTRIDQFGVAVQTDATFRASIVMEMTLLRDRDQQFIGSQTVQGAAVTVSDQPGPIAQAFQQILDRILPDAVSWIGSRA